MDKWDIGSLNKGKTLSESTKKKISISIRRLITSGKLIVPNKGEKLSEDHKRKISQARKGQFPWNKNKIGVMPPAWNKGKAWSKEIKYKISTSKRGTVPWNKGIGRTVEEKRKMSIGAKRMWKRRKANLNK
jgi:hypothetical protein